MVVRVVRSEGVGMMVDGVADFEGLGSTEVSGLRNLKGQGGG